MTLAAETDKLANAKAQGQAQFDSIREMVTPDWETMAKAEGWTLSARNGRFVDSDGNYYDGPVPDGDWADLCNMEGIEESDEAREERETRIQEDVLSVEVRSGWYVPGARDADTKPAEYRILLCTGGPAVQIVGDLSEHGEPETAVMQVQDWFLPWTDFYPATKIDHDTDEHAKAEEILLAYARCFYFGE